MPACWCLARTPKRWSSGRWNCCATALPSHRRPGHRQRRHRAGPPVRPPRCPGGSRGRQSGGAGSRGGECPAAGLAGGLARSAVAGGCRPLRPDRAIPPTWPKRTRTCPACATNRARPWWPAPTDWTTCGASSRRLAHLEGAGCCWSTAGSRPRRCGRCWGCGIHGGGQPQDLAGIERCSGGRWLELG